MMAKQADMCCLRTCLITKAANPHLRVLHSLLLCPSTFIMRDLFIAQSSSCDALINFSLVVDDMKISQPAAHQKFMHLSGCSLAWRTPARDNKYKYGLLSAAGRPGKIPSKIRK
jgi:hypothetical protein